MAKLPIIIAPDPRLKITATPVDRVDSSVRKFMDDLLDTMYAAPGIGLAAPQVGVAKRILVIDLAQKDSPAAPLQIVNPKLIWASEELASNLDQQNIARELEATGMLSACLQLEIDHLDGRLFVDHLSRLKRNMILRKLSKLDHSDGNADHRKMSTF